MRHLFVIYSISLFFITSALALEPLSEDELYDTSGKATPTVSIKYSDELTIDYFNQNVFIYEPRGEQSLSVEGAYYIDTDTKKSLLLYWPEPLTMIFEFDKFQYYPNGIHVAVSDIFATGEDGRPLPQYAEFEPNPFDCIGPNRTYLRTKSGPTTVTMLNNKFDIALVGTVEEKDPISGKLALFPDLEQARQNGNILMSMYMAYRTRTEMLGYVYIWSHE